MRPLVVLCPIVIHCMFYQMINANALIICKVAIIILLCSVVCVQCANTIELYIAIRDCAVVLLCCHICCLVSSMHAALYQLFIVVISVACRAKKGRQQMVGFVTHLKLLSKLRRYTDANLFMEMSWKFDYSLTSMYVILWFMFWTKMLRLQIEQFVALLRTLKPEENRNGNDFQALHYVTRYSMCVCPIIWRKALINTIVATLSGMSRSYPCGPQSPRPQNPHTRVRLYVLSLFLFSPSPESPVRFPLG